MTTSAAPSGPAPKPIFTALRWAAALLFGVAAVAVFFGMRKRRAHTTAAV